LYRYYVCMKEWFDEPKRVLLIMEFVTGGTLFDRIVNSGGGCTTCNSVVDP
jgi:hypothetical protein